MLHVVPMRRFGAQQLLADVALDPLSLLLLLSLVRVFLVEVEAPANVVVFIIPSRLSLLMLANF